jgi:hypothetical protein
MLLAGYGRTGKARMRATGLCDPRYVRKHKNNTSEASKLLKIKESVFHLVRKPTQNECSFACPTHDFHPKSGSFLTRTSLPLDSACALWKVRVRATGICHPEVRQKIQNSGNEAKKLLKTKEVTFYKVRKRTRIGPISGAQCMLWTPKLAFCVARTPRGLQELRILAPQALPACRAETDKLTTDH